MKRKLRRKSRIDKNIYRVYNPYILFSKDSKYFKADNSFIMFIDVYTLMNDIKNEKKNEIENK